MADEHLAGRLQALEQDRHQESRVENLLPTLRIPAYIDDAHSLAFWEYFYPAELVQLRHRDSEPLGLYPHRNSEAFRDERTLQKYLAHYTGALTSDALMDEDQPPASEELFMSDAYIYERCMNATHYAPPLTQMQRQLLLDVATLLVDAGLSHEENVDRVTLRHQLIGNYIAELKRRRHARRYRRWQQVRAQRLTLAQETVALLEQELHDKGLMREHYYEASEPTEFVNVLGAARRKAIKKKMQQYLCDPRFRRAYRDHVYHTVNLPVPADDTMHMDGHVLLVDRTVDFAERSNNSSMFDVTANQSDADGTLHGTLSVVSIGTDANATTTEEASRVWGDVPTRPAWPVDENADYEPQPVHFVGSEGDSEATSGEPSDGFDNKTYELSDDENDDADELVDDDDEYEEDEEESEYDEEVNSEQGGFDEADVDAETEEPEHHVGSETYTEFDADEDDYEEQPNSDYFYDHVDDPDNLERTASFSSFNDDNVAPSEFEWLSAEFDENPETPGFEKPISRTKQQLFDRLAELESQIPEEHPQHDAMRDEMIAMYHHSLMKRRNRLALDRLLMVHGTDAASVDQTNLMIKQETEDKMLDRGFYYSPDEPIEYQLLHSARLRAIRHKHKTVAFSVEYLEAYINRVMTQECGKARLEEAETEDEGRELL